MARRCEREIDDPGQTDGDAEQCDLEFRVLLPGTVEPVDQTPGEEHTQRTGGQNDEAVSEANITHTPAVNASETGGNPGEQRIADNGIH